MAGKLQPLPTIGATDLSSITEFLGYLKDPEKYRERLDALEAQRKEINALIETVGKVKEIDSLRTEAFRDRETAGKLLQETQELQLNTNAKVDQDIKDAQAHISQLEAECHARINDRENALRNGERDLKVALEDYNRKRADLQDREARVASNMTQASETVAKYEKAIAALKSAIEESAKVL